MGHRLRVHFDKLLQKFAPNINNGYAEIEPKLKRRKEDNNGLFPSLENR